MRNIRNLVRRQQSERFRPAGGENALKALLRTCAKLPIADHKRFIYLLLEQVFLLPAPLLPSVGKWNTSIIRTAYMSLLDISTDLADSLFESAWALSIKEVNPWLRG